ncbi:MAG: LysM peptidoglycan-binding domain-containing protein [Granulosicoccus sp.]
MVSTKTVNTARFILAISVAVLSSACSAPQGPSAWASEEAPSAIRPVSGQHKAGFQTNGTVNAPRRTSLDKDELKDTAPEAYTVVEGDTLWAISDRFLKEPWRWTEIWSYNPQIYNPHLIYPGDELTLDYVHGIPTLTLTRNGWGNSPTSDVPQLGAANPVNRQKLSPRIRSLSLDAAIPTVSLDSVGPFLLHPMVISTGEQPREYPYIVDNANGELMSSKGDYVYARGQITQDQPKYGIYRPGKPLVDPVNGALLGEELIHVADATLTETGDPSTLLITDNNIETNNGDILLPANTEPVALTFKPRLPRLQGEARIVSLVDAISQSARNQVVVLNIGSNSNIQEGDVLAVETKGRLIVDKQGVEGREKLALPDQRTGVLMVFKSFEKVSYALVMESTHPVKINDRVTGI